MGGVHIDEHMLNYVPYVRPLLSAAPMCAGICVRTSIVCSSPSISVVGSATRRYADQVKQTGKGVVHMGPFHGAPTCRSKAEISGPWRCAAVSRPMVTSIMPFTEDFRVSGFLGKDVKVIKEI